MQAKIDDLKQSLNTEFKLIHELCLFVLTASQKPDLIRATLATLHAFLSWVPLGFILQTNIIEVLLKLFPQPHYRSVALQCLTEVPFLPSIPQQIVMILFSTTLPEFNDQSYIVPEASMSQ